MSYREYPHNKIQYRKNVNEKELEVLLSCFQKEHHRKFVRLYYGEGYTISKCAELMNYSQRTIERTKQEVDKTAFYSLLTMVTNSENALKLSKIRNIIIGGDE